MKTNQLIVRCYAKQEEGVWVAVSLDFALATQGDSLSEVKKKLEDQLYSYVSEALQDKEYGVSLLTRRAPISSWLEYYYIKLTNLITHKTSLIFDEIMPMRLA